MEKISFTSQSNRNFEMETSSICFPLNPIVSIQSENESYYYLEVAGQRCELNKELIQVNQIPIIEGKIHFSESLYEAFILKQLREKQEKDFNELFINHLEVIFNNRTIIENKPEYFLLRPKLFISASHAGTLSYCLGALLEECFLNKSLYFESIVDLKKVCLLNITGSLMSGIHSAVFWSFETNSIELRRNVLSLGYLKVFEKMAERYPFYNDFQGTALKQLIAEITMGK